MLVDLLVVRYLWKNDLYNRKRVTVDSLSFIYFLDVTSYKAEFGILLRSNKGITRDQKGQNLSISWEPKGAFMEVKKNTLINAKASITRSWFGHTIRPFFFNCQNMPWFWHLLYFMRHLVYDVKITPIKTLCPIIWKTSYLCEGLNSFKVKMCCIFYWNTSVSRLIKKSLKKIIWYWVISKISILFSV